ncbi:hypothetical protein, partial [Streptomyces mirabilis]|uniref:hypothetical protein n=1 Tax=Streptomyces mirabilis TaxID=68239 RepID=UPI0038048007
AGAARPRTQAPHHHQPSARNRTSETSAGGSGAELPTQECIKITRTIQVNEFTPSRFYRRPRSFEYFLCHSPERCTLNSHLLKSHIDSLNGDVELHGNFLIGKSVSVELQ